MLETLLDIPKDFYYEVNGMKTINKITALNYADNDISKIKFYFYDDLYDKVDWTIEPEEHINDLIDQYILKLRDSASYLALWYSGGFDSSAIVDGFIRTKTLLDEIVVYKREWQPSDVDFEYQDAIAKVREFKSWYYPNLKIRTFSYKAEDTYNFYKDYKDKWIVNQISDNPAFSRVARRHSILRNSELQNTLCHGRIDIDGLDKPWLHIKDNNWYLAPTDKALGLHMGSPCVHFFFEPRIYCKQAHLSMRWFEQSSNVTQELVNKIQTIKLDDSNAHFYSNWNIALGRPIVPYSAAVNLFKRSQYSSWGMGLPESKPLAKVAHDTNHDAFKIYIDGIKTIQSMYRDVWKPTDGFPQIAATPRFLRSIICKLSH